MATIAPTSMTGSGDRIIAVTTLDGTDDFVYNASKKPVLVLKNPTAGDLTPIIDGAGGDTVPCAGVGDVDVSLGFNLSTTTIGMGVTLAIPLTSISAFLQGVIAITGGTGIEAQLLEF